MSENINIRVFFSKKDRAKYISALDMNKCMQRAIRRSSLPIWKTQGFNPHTYVTFALPLSLGTEGLMETMDTKLTEKIDFDMVVSEFNRVLPPDIRVIMAALPVKKHTEIEKAEYKIISDCDFERLVRFLNRDVIIAQKKTKKGISDVDLKQYMEILSAKDNTIIMRLPAGTNFTINPNLVYEAFEKSENLQIRRLDITRTRIICKDGSDFE